MGGAVCVAHSGLISLQCKPRVPSFASRTPPPWAELSRAFSAGVLAPSVNSFCSQTIAKLHRHRNRYRGRSRDRISVVNCANRDQKPIAMASPIAIAIPTSFIDKPLQNLQGFPGSEYGLQKDEGRKSKGQEVLLPAPFLRNPDSLWDYSIFTTCFCRYSALEQEYCFSI